MSTSTTYDYTTSRDNIIKRALRNVGAIGQGETPEAVAVTEAAQALNELVKEWEADGMPLWALTTFNFVPITGTSTYTIGTGQDVDNVAPTKIIQAWNRTSTTSNDSPILIITEHQYDMLGSKTTGGTPSQLNYRPPGNLNTGVSVGTVRLYPVPDANYVLYGTVYFNGIKPFQNFDAAADVPDFPQYWYNAVMWGLADQLSYEYGVSYAGRSMISKKAQFHKDVALSYGTEEGSLLIQPQPSWDWESY